MFSRAMLFSAIIAVTSFMGVSHAGIIQQVDCSFSSQVAGQSYIFNVDTQTLTLSESVLESGALIGMTGLTVGDPTFNLSVSVQNNTDFAWTSYELTLLGTGAQFDYTTEPSSSHFHFANKLPTVLTFTAPNAVNPGESVLLNFAINIPNPGQFSFSMQQTAAPEPLTLALLGIGGLVLRIRNK